MKKGRGRRGLTTASSDAPLAQTVGSLQKLIFQDHKKDIQTKKCQIHYKSSFMRRRVLRPTTISHCCISKQRRTNTYSFPSWSRILVAICSMSISSSTIPNYYREEFANNICITIKMEYSHYMRIGRRFRNVKE